MLLRWLVEALLLTGIAALVYLLAPLLPLHERWVDDAVSSLFLVLGFWLLLRAAAAESARQLIIHGALVSVFVFLLAVLVPLGMPLITLRANASGIHALQWDAATLSLGMLRVLALTCVLSLQVLLRLKHSTRR